MAAAAERSSLDPVDRPPRARDDFQRAGEAERPVLIGRDRHDAVALGERGARRARRLPGGGESRPDMRSVAIGLVVRLPAAAERRPRSDALALELDLGVNGERTVFSHCDRVDLWIGLLGAAV